MKLKSVETEINRFNDKKNFSVSDKKNKSGGYTMKSCIVIACLMFLSLFLVAQPATISLPYAGDVAQNMSNIGITAFYFAEDPYAAVPTIYFTGYEAAAGVRHIYKMEDPLSEHGGREFSTFAQVPVYIDRGEGDVIEDWPQWTYMTGIAVSEDYVFAGGRTFKTETIPNPDYDPEDPDSPETITVPADSGGFYIARYNKSDGSFDSAFKNANGGHRVNHFLMYDAGEEQTFYVDSDGNYTDADDPDGTAYTGQKSLIATQQGRAVFAIDPEKPAGAFTTGSNGWFGLGLSPRGWSQILRTSPRGMAYDYDAGDLYISVSGTSSAVSPENLHAMWGGRYGIPGSLYPDGFPAFDNPGVIRMRNFDPFKYDWGMNDGEDTLEVLTLPEVETNSFMGVRLFTYDDAKFLVLTDFAGATVYFYYLHERAVAGKDYKDIEAYFIRTASFSGFDPITVQSDVDGEIYLLISGGWTMTAYRLDIEVFGVDDDPTFSAHWNLFE